MDADHGFWGRPEDMNMARYVIIITVVKMFAKIIITILEMVVKMSKILTVLTMMSRPAQSIGPGNPGSDLARWVSK